MYTAFIRLLLEYSDIMWGNSSTETQKQLDAIHSEAGRLIGATKLCNIDKIYSNLGWESLQSRRNKQSLVPFFFFFFFFFFFTKSCMDYLQTILWTVCLQLYRKQLGNVSETLTIFRITEPIIVYFLIGSFQPLFMHGTTCQLKQERH